MYDIFKLPENFLTHKYTEDEKDRYDQLIHEYVVGKSHPITEELTPKQKLKVDRWYGPTSETTQLHDKIFGKGVDRIHLPYDDSQDEKVTTENYNRVPEMRNMPGAPIHRTILSKLAAHGYKVEDYSTGLTHHESDPKRKVKITAALQKIGAANTETGIHRSKSGSMMTYEQAYAADPVRAAAKKDKQIVITRNPYDVAGMSTGRGWTSCMNLESGSNRRYVKHDIGQGTLTAYLCTKEDNGINHPIGRVNLKKFSHLSTGHTIFKPEESTYGTIPTTFRSKVENWATQNYPEKDAGIYMKHTDLYNDDGKDTITHKLHELDPEKDLHRLTEDAVHGAVSQEYNRDYNKHVDFMDSHEKIDDTINNYHENLTDKQHAHSVIHWTADHSFAHDGDKPKGLDSIDVNPRNSDEFLHHYATNAVGTTRVKRGISEFTPHDSMIALSKIHDAINKTEDEEHEHLKDVHGDVIDHVFKQTGPEWNPVKEHVVDHLLEPKNKNYYIGNRDYNIIENTSHHLQKSYLPQLSTNPRKIHRLLDFETEHMDEQSLGNATAVSHIAKHADAKLVHHVLLEHPDGDLQNERFVEHLNENPSGEQISHTLLNPMYFRGGSDEDHEIRHHDAIAYLAKHTKHKSVFDRIKTRIGQDFSDEPYIKKALNINKTFGQQQHMEHYMRWL